MQIKAVARTIKLLFFTHQHYFDLLLFHVHRPHDRDLSHPQKNKKFS